MWLFKNRKKYKKKLEVTFIEDTDFIVVTDDLYKKQDEDDDDQQHEIIKTMSRIIDRQARTIEQLTKPKIARKLTANYFIE